MDIETPFPQGVLAIVETSEGEKFLIKEQSVLDALFDAIYEARKKSRSLKG